MKRSIYLICVNLLLLLSGRVAGQNTDLGIMLGGANYLGELAPDVAYNETRPFGTFFVRNRFSPYFALRSSMSLGRVKGDDANFAFNKSRNLSFRSNIFEIASVLEFNFLPFGREILTKDFTSYVFLGLGFFKYNPKAQFNGKWTELQAIGTEGQTIGGGRNYRLSSLVLPFGLGVKQNLNDHWILGFELGFRRTYTDYLDDVSKKYPDFSQAPNPDIALLSDRSGEVNGGTYLASPGDARGNPDNKDWYMFSGFTLAYRITPPRPCYKFY